MPSITIQIDEQQEAKIMDLINRRKDFRIDGGAVADSDGKFVFLKGITFTFMDQDVFMKREPLETVERQGNLKGDS